LRGLDINGAVSFDYFVLGDGIEGRCVFNITGRDFEASYIDEV